MRPIYPLPNLGLMAFICFPIKHYLVNPSCICTLIPVVPKQAIRAICGQNAECRMEWRQVTDTPHSTLF